MTQFVLPELNAMQQISEIVSNLSLDERKRVAAWFVEFASQSANNSVPVAQPVVDELVDAPLAQAASDDFAVAAPVTVEDDDLAEEPAEKTYASFAELYAAADPKKGAQKAAVAGYWLETREGQRSWKASEVNKLLKSIDVKVSSMSIVLTNAVKAKAPLMEELERLGDSARSRKTFCLSENGLAYVENQLA